MTLSSFAETSILILLLFIGLVADASKAYVIQSKSWQYKGHHIGYEEAKRVVSLDDDTTTDTSNQGSNNNNNIPILVLNGFGVGSFHQHRLMPNLISVCEDGGGNDEVVRTVFGVDYLGQGRSWPIDCDDGNSMNEKGLIYSIDMWADQIIEFIESVIIMEQSGESAQKKVHLIGNSVGGHLSVILAAKRPDLIESICLLNATPVGGLNLPGWNGVLPPPAIPRKIGRYLFDQIRDLDTIEKYLTAAYANKDAFDNELVSQIRACTEGQGGHAAFASILWSPPTGHDKDFYSILSQLKCDVLLIFGKDDPWCTPAFAKRMYQSLQKRSEQTYKYSDIDHAPVQRYIEIDNCGHCPNHEAPSLVGSIASRWTSASLRQKDSLPLLPNLDATSDAVSVNEPWGRFAAREVNDDETDLSLIEKIITSMV